MLYICMGGFKKRLKESMKQKLARVSRSEAENRNSTIPTARETLLDNTVTNGSRANSLRFVKLRADFSSQRIKLSRRPRESNYINSFLV